MRKGFHESSCHSQSLQVLVLDTKCFTLGLKGVCVCGGGGACVYVYMEGEGRSEGSMCVCVYACV